MPSLLSNSSDSKSEPSSDSSGSKPDPESEPSGMMEDFVPRGKGHTARLRGKRNLKKLAWQVADHLPCKFSEWRKGPEKWLKLVEAACLEVELPPAFIMGKLSRAIGFESMKMADKTAEGGRVKGSWSEYRQAFINFFPGLPPTVTRNTWTALSQEKFGSYHKYVEQFQQQAEELQACHKRRQDTSEGPYFESYTGVLMPSCDIHPFSKPATGTTNPADPVQLVPM